MSQKMAREITKSERERGRREGERNGSDKKIAAVKAELMYRSTDKQKQNSDFSFVRVR